MVEKISFSIEDARIINENPNSKFAVLSLDFFASGKNLHDMYVSEDTLMRTADSIKNCPLVWKYDKLLDDIYTHDKDEVPCGFVPESSQIESRILADGRTMLSVVAYVWKRYTGDLLKIFKRDGAKKPVSVEMSVYKSQERADGLVELLDFVYEGITVLGTFINPAIPLANAKVISFSDFEKEYKEDLKEEFPYIADNLLIPDDVKRNAEMGLSLRREHGGGGNTVSLSFAKYITKNQRITPDKARYITEYFSTHKTDINQQGDPPSEGYISSLLLGGVSAWKWAQSIVDGLNKEENRMAFSSDSEVVTFPYKSKSDINPALKGITPPITVSQANEIARQADAVGSGEGKSGWAIAISSFKKTHVVKDGKWVKKNSEKMEMAMGKQEENETTTPVEEEVQMAEETQEETQEAPVDEAQMAEEENPSEDKSESSDDEEEEEKKDEPKKFEYPEGFDFEIMGQMFAEDDDESIKMAKESIEKDKFCLPDIMFSAMFAKMTKMSKMMKEMAEQNLVYMEENVNLNKFKADMETQQKNFEVAQTIKELEGKVVLTAEAKEEMLADAENYSFATISEWVTRCRAKSFDFAIRESGKSDVVRVGMPFTANSPTNKNDLWS